MLSADTAEELNKRGDHYYEGGRYDLAIADYTAAIKLQPGYAKALGSRGWCWWRKGDYVTALADFNEAIALDPRDMEFYQGRARVYIAQQEYDKAMSDCIDAIRLEPAKATLFNQRGDVFFYQGKFDQAIPDYAEAIRLDDSVAEYFNNRGACYSRLSKNEEAIADYTKAIELDATEPQYLYNRATAYQKLENNAGMALDFLTLEQNFPEFAKKQQTFYDRRVLHVTNATNERLQFWVKYYNKTEDGEWKWFPAPPGEGNYAVYFLKPGESTYLEHAGVRINASKIRFWAGNAATTADWDKSTRRWPGYEEQDYILLPEEGEHHYFMRTYDLRLQ
jgi:tetratricopeptide (TPR) repeat protein